MNPTLPPDDFNAVRRAAARRTALITASVAAVILIGFIISLCLR